MDDGSRYLQNPGACASVCGEEKEIDEDACRIVVMRCATDTLRNDGFYREIL